MYYGELVCLRPLEMSDLEASLEHWNTWELRRTIGVPLPISIEGRREWLEARSKVDPWSNGNLVLAVIEKKTGMYLGAAGLRDIAFPHRRAEFGISIDDKKNRSKGYGTDATRVMLWIAFHVLGLETVYLDTFPDNLAAIKSYENVGFKSVGLLRKTEFREGVLEDLLIMDITKEEFFQEYPPGKFVGHP